MVKIKNVRYYSSGKLTSHDLTGHSDIHHGLGPYDPGVAMPLVNAHITATVEPFYLKPGYVLEDLPLC